MNLQEMGAKLRQERERRGMTLDEVVLRTKISRTNLEAMEAGRKDDLPHPVYAKGFVKNYARLLGFDPEEFGQALAMEYAVAEDDFGTPPTVEKPRSVPDRRVRSKARSGRRQSLVLLLAVVVAVGGILAFMLRTPGQRVEEPLVPAAAPVQEAAPPAAPVLPDAASEVAPMPPDVPAAADSASPEAPALSDAAEAPSPPPAEPMPEPVVLETAPEAHLPVPALPSAAAYSHHLDITALDRCWVYAVVDGDTEVDVTLQPGERKRLRFNDSLTVKFGNAGGVELAHDGRAVENPALSGQVRTFTFP